MSLAHLVTRGIELKAKIEADKAELKAIEEALEAAALADPSKHVPLEDDDREGRQVLMPGASGETVPVVLESDMIVGTFAEGTAVHAEMMSAFGDRFSMFFRRKTVFENTVRGGKEFRARAREALADEAPRAIHAATAKDKHGIPKSRTLVAWDRATKPSAS